MMEFLDLLFSIASGIYGFLGFLLNAVLLYLIARKSPPYLSPYKYFLLNTALTQLIYAILLVALQPRVITKNHYMMIIPIGVAKHLSAEAVAYVYVTMLHLASNSIISICISMIYRYLVLKHLSFTVKSVFLFCAAGYFLPFLLVATFPTVHIITDKETILSLVNLTEIDVDKYQSYNLCNVHQPASIYAIVLYSIFLIPLYLIMTICRNRIYYMLKNPNSPLSPSTKEQILKLVKALTMQSAVPIFTAFPASIVYCLGQMQLISTAYPSYTIAVFVGISTVVDPLITMYFVRPYRVFMLRLCIACRLVPRRCFKERSQSIGRTYWSTTIPQVEPIECIY